MDKKSKKVVLELLKSLDLKDSNLPNDPDIAQQKWYRFGAYDALRMASEKINELPELKNVRAK